MHFQAGTANWPESLAEMPDDLYVKSLNDPSILREAVRVWLSLGRRRDRIRTGFRHSDVVGHDTAELVDWLTLYAWWRAQFFRFIDKTFFDEGYIDFIDEIEEANEYTDNAMARGFKPTEMKRAYRNAVAAAHVWNNEFRGKTVRTPDGGEGFIPDRVQLVIGNVPVGNDVPKSFMELAIKTGNRVGYHPYFRWFTIKDQQGVVTTFRDPGDWRWHSGRWYANEQEFGLKPEWSFTEDGPYGSVENGWLASDVCNGNEDALVQAFVDWVTDTKRTSAFKEGRVNLGAWFTIGDIGWPLYQLRTPQLKRIGRALRPLWVRPVVLPPPPPPPPGDDEVGITEEAKRAMLTKLEELANDLADVRQQVLSIPVLGPRPLYRARIILSGVAIRDRNGNYVLNAQIGLPVGLPIGEVVDVWEELPVIGPNNEGRMYDDRAVINSLGHNVWLERLERIT